MTYRQPIKRTAKDIMNDLLCIAIAIPFILFAFLIWPFIAIYQFITE